MRPSEGYLTAPPLFLYQLAILIDFLNLLVFVLCVNAMTLISVNARRVRA
jgi:hypothetical protein